MTFCYPYLSLFTKPHSLHKTCARLLDRIIYFVIFWLDTCLALRKLLCYCLQLNVLKPKRETLHWWSRVLQSEVASLNSVTESCTAQDSLRCLVLFLFVCLVGWLFFLFVCFLFVCFNFLYSSLLLPSFVPSAFLLCSSFLSLLTYFLSTFLHSSVFVYV